LEPTLQRIIPLALLFLTLAGCGPSPTTNSTPKQQPSSGYKQMIDEATASAESLSKQVTETDKKTQAIREKTRQ